MATGLRCTLHDSCNEVWSDYHIVLSDFAEAWRPARPNIWFIPHFIRWGSLTFLFIFCHFLLIWVVFIPRHHLSQLSQIDSPYHICPPSEVLFLPLFLVQDMRPFEPSYVDSVVYLFTCSRELQSQRLPQTADSIVNCQIQHRIDVTYMFYSERP